MLACSQVEGTWGMVQAEDLVVSQLAVCIGLGLGVVAPIKFGSRSDSGLLQKAALYTTFRTFFGSSFFPIKVEGICVCAHRMLVTQSGSRNKSRRFDFLGDFVTASSQKQSELAPYKLGIRYTCT